MQICNAHDWNLFLEFFITEIFEFDLKYMPIYLSFSSLTFFMDDNFANPKSNYVVKFPYNRNGIDLF